MNEPLPYMSEPFHVFAADVRDYAIFLLDSQGRIVTWNMGAEEIKGYSADEIIGKHFSCFYLPEAIATGWPAYELQVAAKEGRFEDEGWRLRKDGSRFWANVVITAMRDQAGDLRGFLKITRDLTERKRHEEALHQSEERYRLLVENVRDYAIFLLDPDGRVASWNSGAEWIKGYKSEEVIGQHFSCFFTPEDADQGRPAQELYEARSTGRAEYEGWRVRKDGSRFWANVVITALRDEAGNLYGFSKITRDLTERMQAEKRLRQTNAELEQRVEERTAELSEKNAALAEANRHKDEFLAILAHELRNPLAPIRTSVQVLQMAASQDPALHQVSEVIARQTDHMARLITDLLDVTRLTRGLVALRLERLDLARLVRTTCEDFRPTMQKAGLVFTVETPETPVWMQGDKTRLAQVLTNLLDNACKFTEPPGKVEVQLVADIASQKAALHVCDSGAGIAPEVLNYLFEPLRQADRSMHRTKGGLGLGLSLVKGLAVLHGGEVEALSGGPRCGAEFIVRLPIEPEPSVLVPAGQPPTPTGKRKRVLVIEDNQDAADTLRLLLEVLGHDVRVANTGPEGVQAAFEWRPDVIFSDIGLPELDGYGVARELRENEATADTKLIAVTGYGSDEDQQRARESGFNHVIIKPAEPAVLIQLLANGA